LLGVDSPVLGSTSKFGGLGDEDDGRIGLF